MMVSFDFLANPIDLSKNRISVLCIENTQTFRDTVLQFHNGCPEEGTVIFSENFAPIKFSGNVFFVPDFFSLSFSSGFMKKVYEDISTYLNTYLQEDTARFRSETLSFLEKITESFDFDFDYNENLELVDFLKIQEVRPSLCKENLLSTLLDFLVMTKKYLPVKCFVLLNLHLFFGKEELESLYKELEYHEINILVLESQKSFDISQGETVYIVDKDMCEIIDS